MVKTHTLLIGFALLLLLAAAGSIAAQGERGDLLARINNLRASLGLPGYTLNGQLGAAAQGHAQWMADTATVAHTRPDGSTPRSRAAAAGYTGGFVSENIYMGTNASVGTAWNFWVNSAVHYAGLTSNNYSEVGIGIASGAGGRAYVLVFGSTAQRYAPPQRSGGSGASAAANNEPPPYVLGQDVYGNIMHEIQPGDTPGDIALLYGYSWDDIPGMMTLNGLADNRALEIGAVFLVPPYEGTWTPEPGQMTATPAATDPPPESTAPPEAVAQDTMGDPQSDLGILPAGEQPRGSILPTATQTPTPPTVLAPTGQPAATASATATPQAADAVTTVQVISAPTLTPTGPAARATRGVSAVSVVTVTPAQQVAMRAEADAAAAPATGDSGGGNTNTLLLVAVLVQTVVIVAAGIEFMRRKRG